MITPLLQLTFSGVIWYQGESNAVDPSGYACRFPAMIQDWRKNFRNPSLPFVFVLLAGYKEGGHSWPLIREAQLAALNLSDVYVASAQDMGDPTSPLTDIHSRNKTILAERMANITLKTLYGQTDLVIEGPIASPSQISAVFDKQTNTANMNVTFDNTLIQNQELFFADTGECWLCCAALNGSAFTVELKDEKVLRATATVDQILGIISVNVDVSSSSSPIINLSYNQEAYAQCALYNAAVLPMLPMSWEVTESSSFSHQENRPKLGLKHLILH